MKIDPNKAVLHSDFYSQVEKASKIAPLLSAEQDKVKVIESIKAQCLSPCDELCWRNNGWAKMYS